MNVSDLAELNDNQTINELVEKETSKCPHCHPGQCRGRECSHDKLWEENTEKPPSERRQTFHFGGCV